MTMISLVEIFSNPYDLYFMVKEDSEKLGTFVLAITRGPEHRGKLIVTGEDFLSKESAIKTIVTILNTCVEKGNEVFCSVLEDEETNLLKSFANPNNLPSEKWTNALTNQMVKKIESDLNENRSCSTCEWLVLLQKEDMFAIALSDWDNVLVQAEGKDDSIQMIKDNIPRLTESKAKKFFNKIEEYFN